MATLRGWSLRLRARRLAEWVRGRATRARSGDHRARGDRYLALAQLHHTSAILGDPIIYTQPSYDPYKLPGPLAHFRLNRDGSWTYINPDLPGWSATRLWWTCYGPVISALHADFEARTDHHN